MKNKILLMIFFMTLIMSLNITEADAINDKEGYDYYRDVFNRTGAGLVSRIDYLRLSAQYVIGNKLRGNELCDINGNSCLNVSELILNKSPTRDNRGSYDNFELNDTLKIYDNKRETYGKFISSDRLYYGGKPFDMQSETILLKNIMSDSALFRFVDNEFKTLFEITEEGVKSSGKICDIDGCIGDKKNNNIPAGTWCGLCGDGNINVESCDGYNVCEECPNGYMKKSFSHMTYIDSKATFQQVLETPKNDYICIKN